MPCEKLAAVLTPDVIAADPKLANVALLHRVDERADVLPQERVAVTKGHVSCGLGWAITSISEEQFWKRSLTSYGDGRAKDCLSAIISDWTTPAISTARAPGLHAG